MSYFCNGILREFKCVKFVGRNFQIWALHPCRNGFQFRWCRLDWSSTFSRGKVIEREEPEEFYTQLVPPPPARFLTCDGQLSHKEGHSRLPLPPPRGEQHDGVSDNGDNEEDPQSYQLLGLWETKQHKTAVPHRIEAQASVPGGRSPVPYPRLAQLSSPETKDTWSLLTPIVDFDAT